jgi:hypothetical protein
VQAVELANALLLLVNSIITNVSNDAQSEEDSSATDTTPSPAVDTNMSRSAEVDATHQMIQFILKHPTIINSFLPAEENCSIPLILSQYISKNVTTVLHLALDAEMDSSVCVPYLDKLHWRIFQDKNGSEHQMVPLLIFSRLASYIDSKRIVRMINKILELPIEDLVSDEGLLPAGETVFCALHQITKGRTILRNGNCHKNFDGLTYSAIQKLCNVLFEAPSQTRSFLRPPDVFGLDYLYGIFKTFLETFPHYAAVFDYKDFLQLVHSEYDDNPELLFTIVSVAELVLKYNTAGKTFFQTWIDSGDKRIKKHRLLYVPLFTTYLGLVGSGRFISGIRPE